MSDTRAQGFETIKVESLEDGTVLAIQLDQPKANILTRAMMDEISRALAQHALLPHLRMVLLRGSAGHFSFGASVEEHRPEQAPEMLATFHKLVRDLGGYPVPIAALVEGRCLGGAFELVLCAHLVFATAGAVFACPEIKLGVFPPVLAVLGRERLGAPTSERLLLTGGDLDATGAHRLGFVTAIVPEGKDPKEYVLDWYRQNLRSLSAYSLREGVRAMRVGTLHVLGAPLDAVERQYKERLLASHDGREGIDAFLEKRKPEWHDA